MKKTGKQLELLPLKQTAADRRAWIRARLVGYGFRQAAREAERRKAAARRKARLEAGTHSPEQLTFLERPEGYLF